MNRRTVTKLGWLLAALLLAIAAFLPAAPAQAEADAPGDVKFSGVIVSVPPAATYPRGAWNIAGRTILVTAATHVRPPSPAARPGMWADVTARRTDAGLVAQQLVILPPEVRIKGPIGARPTDPGVGDWTIAGLTIHVTAETRISDRGGPLAVGNWAEVFALKTDTGLKALRLRGIETQPDVEVFGAIEAFSSTAWTLSSIPLKVTESTLIVGTPAVGLLAQAAAELQADNSLQAIRLRVLARTPGEPEPPEEFDGTIEALPERGLIGLWTVSGRTVLVSPLTRIDQVKGLAVVGATVHVVGRQVDDKVLAAQIVVQTSPQPGGRFVRFIGPIQALPAAGLIGEWQIAERTVVVTADTVIGGQTPQTGKIAAVEGLARADHTVLALRILVSNRPGPPR